MNKPLRKILLVFLMAVFTVFNTGIPVLLHYCNSMKKMDVTVCPMCKEQHKDTGLSYKAVYHCCDTKVAATASNENFVVNHNNGKHIVNVAYISDIPSLNINCVNSKSVFTHVTDVSPPSNTGKDLLIFNSTLLI